MIAALLQQKTFSLNKKRQPSQHHAWISGRQKKMPADYNRKHAKIIQKTALIHHYSINCK
jgi:hypothetical protein